MKISRPPVGSLPAGASSSAGVAAGVVGAIIVFKGLKKLKEKLTGLTQRSQDGLVEDFQRPFARSALPSIGLGRPIEEQISLDSIAGCPSGRVHGDLYEVESDAPTGDDDWTFSDPFAVKAQEGGDLSTPGAHQRFVAPGGGTLAAAAAMTGSSGGRPDWSPARMDSDERRRSRLQGETGGPGNDWLRQQQQQDQQRLINEQIQRQQDQARANSNRGY